MVDMVGEILIEEPEPKVSRILYEYYPYNIRLLFLFALYYNHVKKME